MLASQPNVLTQLLQTQQQIEALLKAIASVQGAVATAVVTILKNQQGNETAANALAQQVADLHAALFPQPAAPVAVAPSVPSAPRLSPITPSSDGTPSS